MRQQSSVECKESKSNKKQAAESKMHQILKLTMILFWDSLEFLPGQVSLVYK